MQPGWRRNNNTLQDIDRCIKTEHGPENHRRHGRMKPNFIWCNVGKVLDISASGVRLSTKRKVNGSLRIVLRGPTRVMLLESKVMWCRRIGLFRHEVGLQFVNVSKDVAADLRSMAVFQ